MKKIILLLLFVVLILFMFWQEKLKYQIIQSKICSIDKIIEQTNYKIEHLVGYMISVNNRYDFAKTKEEATKKLKELQKEIGGIQNIKSMSWEVIME